MELCSPASGFAWELCPHVLVHATSHVPVFLQCELLWRRCVNRAICSKKDKKKKQSITLPWCVFHMDNFLFCFD